MVRVGSEAPRIAARPEDARAPRLSIVMPTYRRPHHIGDSIRSLLAQSWTDFELLVRDDGEGSDGTREAVHAAAARDPRVRYHRNPRNLRMPANLNAGIKESRGELIVVCHDHDLYTPVFLEEMVRAADRHPSALYVHTGIAVISQEGEPVAEHIADWPELTPGREWLRFMVRSHHCPVCALTLVRRSAHERFGLYDPQYGFIADVEMWMRLAAAGDVAYVGRPLIQVREREADHFAHSSAVPLLTTNARIRRRYLSPAYPGPARAYMRIRMETMVGLRWLRLALGRCAARVR